MIATTDHTLGGSSMSYVQMETLLDILAERCVELDSSIVSMRNDIRDAESALRKTTELLETVRREVQAGKMSAEAAVQVLSGPPTGNFDSAAFLRRASERKAS